MAKIIDLERRKQQQRGRPASEDRSRRMELMIQMLQCSRCSMKCMKCGSQLQSKSQADKLPSLPYRFCESCAEEYEEFLARLHDRGNPEFFWYNTEWMGVWKAWMKYQDALQRYELSDGFRRLLDELDLE